jgi:Sulfotransferase family
MLPAIFLAGSGRSGTSWIGDIIASCSGCIPVFEPLHRKVPQVPRWGINSGLPGTYLQPGMAYPEWEAFYEALFAGHISNAWTRQDWVRVPQVLEQWPLAKRIGFRLAKIHYQTKYMRGNRYVIKEIRANLMLNWLTKQTDARFVYLIRHPCAVIASRMTRIKQQELDWVVDVEEILCQPALMRDFLEPFRTIICTATTPIQRQAVLWCVENVIPFTLSKSNDWLVCFYEDFLSEREATLKRLFRNLGLEPSSTTERVAGTVVCNPTHDLNLDTPWHASLTEAEGEEVLRVCEEFGLSLYGRQSMPLCSAGEILGRNLVGSTDRG